MQMALKFNINRAIVENLLDPTAPFLVKTPKFMAFQQEIPINFVIGLLEVEFENHCLSTLDSQVMDNLMQAYYTI